MRGENAGTRWRTVLNRQLRFLRACALGKNSVANLDVGRFIKIGVKNRLPEIVS